MSDRYEIRDEIGKGGLGAVYKAFDTQLHREVAMKRVLTTEHASEEEVRAAADNLIAEAKTLSSLNHPNIVTVFDVGQDDKGGFVVMELLKGETLDETVERGVLTQDDFIEVVIQTMEALIAAQAENVMHRDLKPTNVMVIWQPSGKFQTKILDFGLAKFSKTPSVQTMDQEDAVMGSIYFMAPEQFERAELDQRSDLYQIGCVYYHALTGQYPFRGETAPQVMNAHLQHRVTPLEKLRPDMSPSVCQWVMWLINRDKENRPANAQEALERFPKDPEPPGSEAILQAIPVDESPAGATTGVHVVIPEHDAAPPARLLVTGSAPVYSGSGPIRRHATGTIDPAKKRKALLTVVTIIAALVIGIGGFLFIKNRKQQAAYERVTRLAEAQNPKGGPEEVDLAVEILAGKKTAFDLKRSAAEMLKKLEGNGIDAHILGALRSSDQPYVRYELSQALSERGYSEAVPAIMDAFRRSTSDSMRASLLNSVRNIASDENAKALLDSLSGEYSTMERRQIENILLAIYLQKPRTPAATKPLLDRLDKAEGSERLSLFTVLGSLGTDDVRNRIETIFGGDDGTLKAVAMRALLNWPDRSCLDLIESIVTDAVDENVLRLLAVEAYSRAASLPAAVPLDQKLASWKKALDWSNRVGDFQQIFGSVADNPAPETLAFAQEQAKEGSGNLASLARKAAAQIQELTQNTKPLDATGKLIPEEDVVRGNMQGINLDKEAKVFSHWNSPDTWFAWHFKANAAGDYGVEVIQADPQASGSEFEVIIGETSLTDKSQKTASWGEFKTIPLDGKVSLEPGKIYTLYLRARGVTQPRMMNLQAVRLVSP